MTIRKEREYLIQDANLRLLKRGLIDRRQFLQRTVMTGLGLAGVGAIARAGGIGSAFAQDRPLTPTFYSWIDDFYPRIETVNGMFPGLNYQIAPTEGFGIERFVAEAKDQKSTWDVYVGQTPFVEMSALAAAGVIEPWDNYIPKDVRDDIIGSIHEENLIDGKLYGWPFLLDIIGSTWNSGLTTQAGLPDEAVADWDVYLERAKAVVDAGAAPFGATFDSHGWRSLVPFTHSMSPDVYKDGLFDFTSEPAIEALMLMKKIMAYANPDILLEGATDGGVNGTPDEVAFAAQSAAYYTKYFNAPFRMAQNWDDPSLLRLGPLPKFKNGAGGTVFWTTGVALFKYGQNKEQAAEYIKALTYDRDFWKEAILGANGAQQTAHLPPYKSIYAEWEKETPEWLPAFVPQIRAQLESARAIENDIFGLQQFVIGKPIWETYLKGEESDPKVAMQKVVEAVQAEINRGK